MSWVYQRVCHECIRRFAVSIQGCVIGEGKKRGKEERERTNVPKPPIALATDRVPIAVVPPLDTMGLLADFGVEGLGEGGECLMAILVKTVCTTGPVLASPVGGVLRGGGG